MYKRQGQLLGVTRETVIALAGEAGYPVRETMLNRYDLYTKSRVPPDWTALRPYYEELVAELLPSELQW